MVQARLTLIGLYKYYQREDIDILDGLSHLGIDVDYAVLKHRILVRAGEMPLVYTDGEFLQLAIENWANVMADTAQKWEAVLTAEYNPIHNYDRTESWTDNTAGSNSRTVSREDSRSSSGTATGTDTTDGSTDNKQYVTGYDSQTEKLDGHQTSDVDDTHTTSTSNTGAESGTEDVEESGSDARQSLRTGKVSGNIGVMSTQNMMEQEIRLRKENNLFEMIATEFVSEFCILTY